MNVNKELVEKFMNSFDVTYQMVPSKGYMVKNVRILCVVFILRRNDKRFMSFNICFRNPQGKKLEYTGGFIADFSDTIFSFLGKEETITYFLERAEEYIEKYMDIMTPWYLFQMNLQENIHRIKEMMSLVTEEEEKDLSDETVNITGKVIDLSTMSDEEKQALKLKEKVIVDKKDNEYPIVLIQMADGKMIMFDVDGSVTKNETDLTF